MVDDPSPSDRPPASGGGTPDPAEAGIGPVTAQARRTDRFAMIVPAVALLVGLALGGAFVAVTGLGVSDKGTSTSTAVGDEAATPTGAPTESSTVPTSSPTDLVATVPAACVQLTEDSQAILDLLDQAVTAARDLDATKLSAVVSEMQKAETKLRDQTAACRQAASS